MKDGGWLFTLGTLKAHYFIDIETGKTVCGRSGLKFEYPDFTVSNLERFKCITCKKGILNKNKEGKQL